MSEKYVLPHWLTERRDIELITSYKRLISEARHINQYEILRKLSQEPCSRFWVTASRAAYVIGRIEQGEKVSFKVQSKQRMYDEIYSRYKQLRQEKPHLNLYEAVAKAVRSPAPCFYLTPESLKVIICNIKHRLRR